YKIILDLMKESIILTCQKFGWDRKPFEEAYDQVLNSKFEFSIKAGEEVMSKSKTLLAFVQVDVKLDYAKVSVVVWDLLNNQFVDKIEMLKINLYEIDNKDLFIKIKWISDNEITIFNDTGEIGFRISLKRGISELLLK